MKYTLLKPITYPARTGEGAEIKTLTELDFREEVTMGDTEEFPAVVSADKLTDKHLGVLAAALCGQPYAILRRMSSADWAKVKELVSELFIKSREIGTSP